MTCSACSTSETRGLVAHHRFAPRRVTALDGRTGIAVGLWNRNPAFFTADDAHRYLVRWDSEGSNALWYSDRPIHAGGQATLAPLHG